MNNYISKIILLVIVFVGLYFRTYNLQNNPAGFFCDEAATGYNAYTILKSGVDEYGNKFPLLFKSFGNNRLPIPIYFTVPFVWLLGLNEMSTRLPSAVIGTLTIIVIYHLLKTLYPKFKAVPLAGAFLLAISPWHIHFSRFAEAVIYLPFFIGMGVLLFTKGIAKKENKYIYLSFIAFALGFYTYYASYILIPLSLLICLIVYIKNVISRKKVFLLSFLLFLLISTPLIVLIINGQGLARWNQGVSILSSWKAPEEIARKALTTYSSHYSKKFLFTTGDIDYPKQFITRFSVKGMGEIYWIELPLIIIALLYIIYKRTKSELLILGLLLIHPLPSSLTSDINPLATRSIFGSFTWPLISALGLGIIINKADKFRYIAVSSFIIIALFSFIKYLNLYYKEYPLYSSDFWGWQYGPKEIMEYFLSHKNEYDNMYMEGRFNGTNIFLKFYDPENKCHGKCKDGSFGKYNPQERQLFALSQEEIEKLPPNLDILTKKIIYYPNNNPAFFIGTISQK